MMWLIAVLLSQVVQATIMTTTPRTTWRFVDSEPSRQTVGEIRVTNGATWGEWKNPVFCPNNTFAIGYKMKANL